MAEVLNVQRSIEALLGEFDVARQQAWARNNGIGFDKDFLLREAKSNGPDVLASLLEVLMAEENENGIV